MSPADVVAVVTGGASGLGRATALRLRDAGSTVVSLDVSHTPEQAAEGVHDRDVDVRDPAAVQTAFAEASNLGEVRICVNCAGILRAAVIATAGEPAPLDAMREVIEVNVIGVLNVTRVAAAAMQRLDAVDGERGVIVNTSSVAAFDGQRGLSAYAASKAAIAGMTLPLARDLADSQIRCVAVAPGIFDTPMLSSAGPRAAARAVESVQHPQRLGDPAEFASLVLHIIENPMLNGSVIRLDAAVRLPPG